MCRFRIDCLSRVTLLRCTDGPEEFYALEIPLDQVEERPISHFRSARDNRSEYLGERAHPREDTPTQELSSMNATGMVTQAERAFLIDLKSEKCLSWEAIGRHFPMHNINTLKKAHTLYSQGRNVHVSKSKVQLPVKRRACAKREKHAPRAPMRGKGSRSALSSTCSSERPEPADLPMRRSRTGRCCYPTSKAKDAASVRS